MEKTIFDFEDYKKYLEFWARAQAHQGHGTRKAFAEAIGCQTAYISQVLNGANHLSLEQADRLNSFLSHSRDEANYFLLLVQLARAGTKSLEGHFHAQLKKIHEERDQLKNRIKHQQQLSGEALSTYFSSWHYSAIHVLISIPSFQTKSTIATALQLPGERVADILEFLVHHGLAAQEGDRFTTGPEHIHLGNDSAMILKHHTNWRLQALASLDRTKREELHYSSVVSLARADVEIIKKIYLDAVERAMKKVTDSKEEELYAMCVDFFQVNISQKT
jgi:uncharacterized protein (TIGR02147 family)